MRQHYIAFSTVNLLTNQIVGSNPLNHSDVTPIAMLVHEYLLFVTRSDSTIKDPQNLIDRLKRDPLSYSFGFAPSPGGSSHISLALVARSAGIDARKLRTVIFKSGGEAATAILGGHVDVGVIGIPVATSHVRSGKMRVLAVPASRRLAASSGACVRARTRSFSGRAHHDPPDAGTGRCANRLRSGIDSVKSFPRPQDHQAAQ